MTRLQHGIVRTESEINPGECCCPSTSGRTVHDRNQLGRTQVYQDSLTLPGSRESAPQNLDFVRENCRQIFAWF